MNRTISAEVSLAVACCRWPVDSAGEQRIRAAAKSVEDWECFERVVDRNRIGSLVHRALAEAEIGVPKPVAERLSRHAQRAATQALFMGRESLRLQRAFEAAGLEIMILKGVPLGILAYGELAAKESWDVDLLVSPESAMAAMRLLGELGYENTLDDLGAGQLAAFVAHSKEMAFVHPHSTITADLHWGLVNNARLLRGVSVSSAAQEVAIPGGTLRTLADEELFAYLCVHGASHNWSRLKWLADLAAMLAKRSGAEIDRLYRVAESLGAGRPASLALKLCHRLLGLKLDEEWLSSLRSDALTKALERNVLVSLSYRGGAAEHVRYTAPWLRRIVAEFFLVPGARPTVEQAWLILSRPVYRAWTLLPRRLTFLHSWLGRAGRRAFGKNLS